MFHNGIVVIIIQDRQRQEIDVKNKYAHNDARGVLACLHSGQHKGKRIIVRCNTGRPGLCLQQQLENNNIKLIYGNECDQDFFGRLMAEGEVI